MRTMTYTILLFASHQTAAFILLAGAVLFLCVATVESCSNDITKMRNQLSEAERKSNGK